MQEISYRHSMPMQIRFNDIDKFGHVNNSVYFSYYDLGKTEYFGSVCPNVDWEKDAIVVVHLEVDFISQIFSTDHIEVQTAVISIGTKSFELMQRVIDINTQEVKCVCKSIMVTFDLTHHTSVNLKGEWINAICDFEGKDLRKKK